MRTIMCAIAGCLAISPAWCASDDDIQLKVTPAATNIHVAEAVTYRVEIVNVGKEPVRGSFVLDNYHARLAVNILRPSTKESYRFFNDEITPKMGLNPVWLKSGGKLVGLYCVLFHFHPDANGFVFSEPGEYKLEFSVFWDEKEGPDSTTTATVTVQTWDEKTDARQIEASKIWMRRDIVYAY